MSFSRKAITLTLSSATLLCSCSRSFEQYMEDARNYKAKNDVVNAEKNVQLAITEAHKQKSSKDKLAKAFLFRAELAAFRAQNDTALNYYEQAVKLLEDKKDYNALAPVYLQIGRLNVLARNKHEALENYNKALKALELAGQSKSHLQAETYVAIADLKDAGDRKAALKYLEAAYSILDEIHDGDLRIQIDCLHKLAFIYGELNRENESIEANERAKKLEMSSIRGGVQDLSGFVKRSLNDVPGQE